MDSRTAVLMRDRLLSAILCFSTIMLSAAGVQAETLRGVNLSQAEFGNNVIPGTYGSQYTYGSDQTFYYFASRGLNFFRVANLWERLQPTLK